MSHDKRERSDIFYCLNTSTIRECGLSLRDEIPLIGAAGYSGVEIWISEIDAHLDEGGTLVELSEMLSDNYLFVPNLIAFFEWAHPDEEKRKRAWEDARRIVDIAGSLQCPFVAAPPAGITDSKDKSIAEIARRYSDLLAIVDGSGVRPMLEFWGHSEALKTLDEAVAVMQLEGSTDTCLLADVFHMAKGGSSIEMLGTLQPGRIGMLHVNDYPRSDNVQELSDDDRIYPGDGVAPLSWIYGMLQETGYSGLLSLELFNKGYQKNGAESVLRNGLQKMKNIFEPLRIPE